MYHEFKQKDNINHMRWKERDFRSVISSHF